MLCPPAAEAPCPSNAECSIKPWSQKRIWMKRKLKLNSIRTRTNVLACADQRENKIKETKTHIPTKVDTWKQKWSITPKGDQNENNKVQRMFGDWHIIRMSIPVTSRSQQTTEKTNTNNKSKHIEQTHTVFAKQSKTNINAEINFGVQKIIYIWRRTKRG